MLISMIAAIAKNGVIGNRGQLPWRLPADLKYFKRITFGKPIIMGRKTYESIGRPLPERINIIVTSNPNFQASDAQIVHSLSDALSYVAHYEEVFIIGGSELFQQALPQTARLYLTYIHQDFEGDTYFPEINLQEWHERSREEHQADVANPYEYSFVVLERIMKGDISNIRQDE